METLFELTFQDQTLNPQIGTFTDASQTAGTFTLEDGEYYLTNGDTKGFYAYRPVALQSGLVDDSKVIIEFDLKVVTASANTHTIIGTYTGVDGSGIPTGDKITLQYNAGDIELVLGSGTTATLIESADVVVDQWYHFRIDCTLATSLASTYQVKIDGVSVTTVTGAVADYELGIISVLGTDQHACDECGIKNITLVTKTNMFVGRTALDQALQDVKGYVDSHYVNLTGSQTVGGNKNFTGTTNIQSLTINGVSCGDILTHNVSEFVDVSSNQTIGGEKTFSALRTYFGRDISLYSVRKYGKNLNPASSTYQYLNFSGNLASEGSTNDWSSGYIEQVVNTNGSSRGRWRIQDTAENYVGLELWVDGNDKQFRPLQNGNTDLGTSTNKWKDVNTVLLNGKTPAYSTDIPTKVSQLTNDSGFITSENALPVGSYIQFAGSQAPAGFLVCNGGAISRTTYSALFAVIGTTYGSGDGSTTFNLPDLTDRFLQGSTTSGTVINAGLPNITGGYATGTAGSEYSNVTGAFASERVGSSGLAGGGGGWITNVTFDASRSSSVYGNSTTVQPPALTCLICIKY